MTLTIAILSWNSHRTLRNTLESYKTFGLDKLASQRLIYFQEISTVDKQIAEKYGYDYTGSDENVGIAEAYKRLVERATGRFFLFLENDWVLLEPAQNEIAVGIEILDRGYADVVRYRHRRFPGEPLWTYQFKGHEQDHPTHVLDAVHWTETPENLEGIEKGHFDYYYATAANANWTNNPTMFRTLWIKMITPRFGSRDVEVDFQETWEYMDDVIVAQGNGLFTHRRIG